MNIVQTVDEFTRCVLEEMDFEREVQNMQVFAELYCTIIAGIRAARKSCYIWNDWKEES